MARDRQRAKQRQAERREARMAERREGAGPDPGPPEDVGAPPENVGRSDTVADSPPPPPILDGELEGDELGPAEIYEDELEPDGADGGAAPPAAGPRGVRGGDGPGRLVRAGAAPGTPSRRGGGKVLGFLTACWAELQRVQWPDRRTLTQLTGIVLFFVIIAGAYLGALDAVFSKIIQAIL